MLKLNLPTYQFKVSGEGTGSQIFDQVRKKYVALTPEEWVRQNYVQYMASEKGFPLSRTGIEVTLEYNSMVRRCDIVSYGDFGQPVLIVECKAPKVKIDQNTFDQIARYNMSLQVNYLVVTNGLNHYYCMINHEKKSFSFIEGLPEYNEIVD